MGGDQHANDGDSDHKKDPIDDESHPADSVNESVPITQGPSQTKTHPRTSSVAAWAQSLESDLPFSAPKRDGSIGRLGLYEVLNVVGRGGMGVVVRAFDEQLHRNVAIKLMSSQLTNSPRAKQRFVREARSAATINHPNVITIHAVSEQEGVPFLVMEYVEGKTLQERIKAGFPLDPADLLRISVQICDGLGAAHRRGIIHRDIKPANILLEDGIERVKISDFGLARLAVENSDLTSMGDIVGTPAYMSPEQVRGDDLDNRSDLFSVGCVIYAMVAGRSPFRRSGAIATARCVTDEPHKPLSEVEPSAPKYICSMVDKLLQKDPANRFQTADELGLVLMEHSPTLKRSARIAVEPVPTQPTKKVFSSKQAVIAGAVTVALLASAISLFPKSPSDQTVRETEVGAGPAGVGSTAIDPMLRQEWIVAQDGSGDFERLEEALAAVTPNDVIEVIDAGVYEGPFAIAAERYTGLKLISRKGATLTATTAPSVLTIGGTQDVHIEGFKIRPGPELHGVYMHWDVTGCKLVNLDIDQPSENGWACVLLAVQCHATAERPLLIRGCQIQSSGSTGIYVGRSEQANSLEARDIVIEQNMFSGPATHVSLNHAVRNLNVAFNVFHGGPGIKIALAGNQTSGDINVINNTFVGSSPWIEFGEDRSDHGGLICNNLILDSEESWTESPVYRSKSWQWHHNLWEIQSALRIDLPETAITITSDAGVPGRDAKALTAFIPEAAGDAATHGSGGSFADYVGAISPE